MMTRFGRAVGSLQTVVVAAGLLGGCAHLTGHGDLLDRYARARCIPVTSTTSTGPPTRVWNYEFHAQDGNMVRVSGAQMPGGRIDVQFAADGGQVVVADAGDYIYPSDVRLGADSDRLYVKAQGVSAAFGRAQTWLFDVDLRRRTVATRARVDPRSVPQECQPGR